MKDEFNVEAKIVLPTIKRFKEGLIKLLSENSFEEFNDGGTGYINQREYSQYINFLADKLIEFLAKNEHYKIDFE